MNVLSDAKSQLRKYGHVGAPTARALVDEVERLRAKLTEVSLHVLAANKVIDALTPGEKR